MVILRMPRLWAGLMVLSYGVVSPSVVPNTANLPEENGVQTLHLDRACSNSSRCAERGCYLQRLLHCSSAEEETMPSCNAADLRLSGARVSSVLPLVSR